ncbi:unnamed protein product, partial [Rotaria magnacalcarata]
RDHSVYVSDWNNHRVMKWVEDAKEGIVVAGGQGTGSALTQFRHSNNRAMRWTQGAKQGTVIAGGNGTGAGAKHLGVPVGLSFDRRGNLYVADQDNDRIQRFSIE